MFKHQTIAFLESNFAYYFHLLIFLLMHFQIWCYEIEENRNYSTNLTTDGGTIWNYATGTLAPSKWPDSMLNQITLSISTVEKLHPCKLENNQKKFQPQRKALTTEEGESFNHRGTKMFLLSG